MKKSPWHKPWYIWTGPFALVVLLHHSLHIIDKHETKLKIGYPSQRALRQKVWGSYFFFIFVVLAIPAVAMALLVELLWRNVENLSLGSWPWVYFYPAFLYFNYRHVLWREEHISHLMKAKWDKK